MANPSPLRAVLFRIGDVQGALPAGIVREILPPLPVIRIPGTSRLVAGLANVRGMLVTVVDGYALLGQSRRADDETATIVLDLDGRRAGLRVAEVLDFLELPEGTVAAPADLPGVDPAVADGIAVHDGRHCVLLNLDTVLAPLGDRRARRDSISHGG